MKYDAEYTVRRHLDKARSFFAAWDKFANDFVSAADKAPELERGSFERAVFSFLGAEWEMVCLEKGSHNLRFGVRLI